jgi:hypothetical protein
MRATRLSLIGTTVALAVVNVALAALLVAERGRGTAVAEQLATLEHRRPPAALVASLVGPKPADAVSAPSSTAPGRTSSVPQRRAASTEPGPRTESLETRLRRLTAPSTREANIRQRKGWLREGYPNVVSELQLSPDESSALFDALAEQLLDGEAQAIREAIAGREGFHDRSALSAETRRRVAEILGEERFARFLDYHDGLPDRHQIVDLGSRLANADALGKNEAAQLSQVMREERDRFTQEMRAFGSAVRFQTGHPSWARLRGPDRAADLKFYEAHIQRVADHQARVRERAALFLTPAQLDRLNDVHEEEVTSMRAYLVQTRSVDRQIEENRAADRVSATP